MATTAFPSRSLVDPAALEASLLHKQLDELHDMLYRRGGITPVNAAIEELSKLILLELKLSEDPMHEVPGCGQLAEILDPKRIIDERGLARVKRAFREVASLDEYGGQLPGGGIQHIWPADEPLRIGRPDIVAEAIRILRPHLGLSGSGRHYDVIGTAFDIFLRGRYDHSGGLGTHLTPHTVATHLAQICLSGFDLLALRGRGPLLGDPCCGTGRFLIAGAQEMASGTEDPDHLSFVRERLFGADQSPSAIAKTRINLLLLGIRHPNVFTVGDSIIDPQLDALRGELGLILTNPPFGDGKYDSEGGIGLAASRLPTLEGRTRIDPALAFLVRCLELLKDGGRLGIILPDGLVDGPVLRSALLGSDTVRLADCSIEANISLPTATFAMAGTVARTSALVLRKQSRRASRIFLARADHVGYLKQGSLSIPDPEGDDLPAIAIAAREALSDKPTELTAEVSFISKKPLAARVDAVDLPSLDPARIDPGAVRARSALRSRGLRVSKLLSPADKRSSDPASESPFVSVLHIDDLGAVAWHEAQTYRPLTQGLVAMPGELIFSLLNPRKLRATVVPDSVGPVSCSSEFGIFKAHGDAYEALVLLHHPLVRAQIEPLGRGTSSSRRRITPRDLLAVMVPLVPSAELAELAARLRTALNELRNASIAAADVYGAASP